MKLTTRGRNAVIAMAELAARDPSACTSLADVAAARKLSAPYLEQIFADLRAAGLVCGARGRGGGYRLCAPAATISVLAVVDAVGERFDATACGGKADCASGQRCETHDFWQALTDQTRDFLAATSIAELGGPKPAARSKTSRRHTFPLISASA